MREDTWSENYQYTYEADQDSVYHPQYYKTHKSLDHDPHTVMRHTQSADGRNQTIQATIWQPSDVMATKMFACVADSNPGYMDMALATESMTWREPYEESPWQYPCYPSDCKR